MIWRLLSGLETVFRSCTSEDNNANIERRCRSMALGLMIQRLVHERLWPIPKTSEYRLSVAELSSITEAIREEISSQVLKTCKCASSKKDPSPCGIQLPRIVTDSWRLDTERLSYATFEPHSSSRKTATVSES